MKNFFRTASAQLTHYWFRNERSIFVLLLFLNIIPVFGVEYFFTGDGPAHLYNSNIIGHLLLKDQTALAAFFELRLELIPNLGGHALLTAFNILLPAAMAEKLIYALCLLLLPLAFRYSLRQLNPAAVAFSVLMFPMAHNFCFYIGFQSFCLGLALMFYSIGFFISTFHSAHRAKFIALSLMLFITAIFHLFAALAALLAIFMYLVVLVFKSGISKKKWLRWTGLATLPTIVLCGSFMLSNTGGFNWNQESFSDQIFNILIAVPMMTIDTAEKVLTIPFNLLLLAGTVWVIYIRFQKREKFSVVDFSLITAIILLVLYFILPDKMASGGFVSMRLLLSFFLFMGFWLALSLNRSLPAVAIAVCLVGLNVVMIVYHFREARKLSADASLMNDAVQYIPEGSTVVPMNYSAHWLHYNIGLYLGTEKELVVLDNYEASTTHFPVKWKPGKYPAELLGNFTTSNRPLLVIDPYEKVTGEKIDAVLRWKYHEGLTDSLTLITNKLLEEEFEKVHVSENNDVEVHLRKMAKQ